MDTANPGLAIVTGAASGMGLACAQSLAKAGWQLFLTDVCGDALQQIGTTLPKGTELLAGDITSDHFHSSLKNALEGRTVGAIVHSAGVSPAMGDATRILSINLGGTLKLLHTLDPSLKSGGAVILIASTSGHYLGSTLDPEIAAVDSPDTVANLVRYATDPVTAYAISKRGLLLLAQRRAVAMGRREIRIVTLSPGVIDTPMGRAESERDPAAMNYLLSLTALPRLGRPEEIAAVATFLCSSCASFITGTDILVDGGSPKLDLSNALPSASSVAP